MCGRYKVIFFLVFILIIAGNQAKADFIFLETEKDWQNQGEIENVMLSKFYRGGLELSPLEDGYVTEGFFETEIITTRDSFKNLVASWNAITPGDTYVVVEVNVLLADKVWSDWQVMGVWGSNHKSRSQTVSSWVEGYPFKVEIDIFQILHNNDAHKYKLRATLVSPGGKNTPILLGLGAITYDRQLPYNEFFPAAGWERELKVPARSQMVEDPSIRSRICSPVCLAMVLEYHGYSEPSASVAENVFDHGAGIFGNWSFNVAYAGSLGFRAYVDYYASLNEIKEKIAEGTPVICSLRFGPGELQNSPMTSSAGHLVVVTGFVVKHGEEWVVVNDPAAPDHESVRREYKADEFQIAWRGIVYIVEKRLF